MPINHAIWTVDANPKPLAITRLPSEAILEQRNDKPETAEHFVRAEWLDAVPVARAVNEVGLLGNQNTVCQPTTPKWRHTVERLKLAFTGWDGGKRNV